MTKRQCVDRVTKTRWRYSRDLLRVEATADLDDEAKGLAVASPLRFFFGSITKTTRRRGLQRGVEKCQIARRQTDDGGGPGDGKRATKMRVVERRSNGSPRGRRAKG